MPQKTSTAKTSSAPFRSQDSEACFNHFSRLVAHLPEGELETYNADPPIVRVNLDRGVAAIEPHLAQVAKALPLLDIHPVLELPALALALLFAAGRIFTPASPQEIRARQQRLRPVRRLALDYLEVAAELGLVPAERVKLIRANNGALDEATDAVAIVALFRDCNDSLAGKHPFADAALKQLAEDGNWLIGQLTPRGAAPERAERSADVVVRDQLWTEIVRRYDHLYHAGVAIWGRRKVDDHLPPLLTRAAAPRVTPPAMPAGPAAPVV